MGQDHATQEDLDKIKASVKLIKNVKAIEDQLTKLWDSAEEAQKNNVPRAEIDKIIKQIENKIVEHRKAVFEAAKANKAIGEMFAGRKNLAEIGSAIIKGNMIGISSQLVNIIGNYSFVPVRTVKNFLALGLDTIEYGLGKLKENIINRINENEIDYVKEQAKQLNIDESEVVVPIRFAKQRRLANKLPDAKLTLGGIGMGKEYLKGHYRGYMQGLKQLQTGALKEDIYKRDISVALHPLNAMYENYQMLTGQEKLNAKKMFNNTIEGILGMPAEVTFRFLNLFDKPIRVGAERAKLNEIATLKGLKGLERERFLEMPDMDSFIESKLAGDEATFQQDTVISKWSAQADSAMLKKAKEQRNLLYKAMWYTAYGIKSITVPFVKTPTNVLSEMASYSLFPISFARGIFDMYHGDRKSFNENMAKGVVGLYLAKGIWSLFALGIMTLGQGGNEDKDKKAVAYKTKLAEYRDKPAYYINVDALLRHLHNITFGTNYPTDWQEGDEISSYRKWGLLSTMAMAQAEAYRGMDRKEIQDMSMWNPQGLWRYSTGAVSSAVEQSFITGTSALINTFIGDEAERDRYLVGLAKGAGSLVIPNALRTYIQAQDNYIRETRDARLKGIPKLINQIKNDFKNSLMVGKDNPVKVTIWGEEVKRYEDGSSPLFQLFDITRTKKYGSDFGTKIFELYEKTKDPSVLPPAVSNQVRWKDEDVILDPQTYHDMQIYVGSELKKATQARLGSMEWDEATDEAKINKLKSLYGSGSSKRSKIIDRWMRMNKEKLNELWVEQQTNNKKK